MQEEWNIGLSHPQHPTDKQRNSQMNSTLMRQNQILLHSELQPVTHVLVCALWKNWWGDRCSVLFILAIIHLFNTGAAFSVREVHRTDQPWGNSLLLILMLEEAGDTVPWVQHDASSIGVGWCPFTGDFHFQAALLNMLFTTFEIIIQWNAISSPEWKNWQNQTCSVLTADTIT